MENKESNNEFFSYQGTINRKNYIINGIILILLFVITSLIRFENFEPYIKYKIIYKILIWVVEFFKFVLITSLLSVIYRRIADFSGGNEKIIKIIFMIFFLYPFITYYFGYFLFSSIPQILNIMVLSLIGILPVSIILAIIFAFIKSK